MNTFLSNKMEPTKGSTTHPFIQQELHIADVVVLTRYDDGCGSLVILHVDDVSHVLAAGVEHVRQVFGFLYSAAAVHYCRPPVVYHSKVGLVTAANTHTHTHRHTQTDRQIDRHTHTQLQLVNYLIYNAQLTLSALVDWAQSTNPLTN